MIKFLLNLAIQSFATRYSYDAAYMQHVTKTSASAGLRLAIALPLFTQYNGPKAALEVRWGAQLGSTLDGDCGPCAQLVTNMALEAGVPADMLTLCLQGQAASAGNVGLGFRFAQAAIADAADLDDLRQEIALRFGEVAVTAAACAASSGRIYPVLKRGLGFAKTCSQVNVGHDTIKVQLRT
ncbi:hypothetical protein AB838_21990 [Rhodobacteraceae bacterium (ex Bugula neritina AB1)]|nr:hypothetical protein AB838_21990 [Rhodobacteraceae bacterium (ex Bugula neritina AB1)]